MDQLTQSIATERDRRAAVERSGAHDARLAYVGTLIDLAGGRGDPARVLNAADCAGIDAHQSERDLGIVREALDLQRMTAELAQRENAMHKTEVECEAEETRLKAGLAAVRARRSIAVSRFREAHQASMALDRLQNQRPELFEKNRAVLIGSNNTTKRGKR